MYNPHRHINISIVCPRHIWSDLLFVLFINNSEQEEGINPQSLLLIGVPGAGKSALVNTLSSALRGEYIEKCEVGRGSLSSNTQAFMR